MDQNRQQTQRGNIKNCCCYCCCCCFAFLGIVENKRYEKWTFIFTFLKYIIFMKIYGFGMLWDIVYFVHSWESKKNICWYSQLKERKKEDVAKDLLSFLLLSFMFPKKKEKFKKKLFYSHFILAS